MGGRVPLMKCGPVCTPGYLAETSGQLPPGGKLKHVDLVAAGRLVDLADPRRCRQIRTQLASRNGEILFAGQFVRSEEHTSELQSLMRISYAVFCLKKKKKHAKNYIN